MREDEAATIPTLTAYREVMTTLIKQHHGRVVDTVGDILDPGISGRTVIDLIRYQWNTN